MTVLVFSDSHGYMLTMCRLIDELRPDAVVHLGDCVRDAERLEHPRLINVAGNCDYAPGEPKYKIAELGGKRFMLTHGHAYGVKQGLDKLVGAAKLNRADAVLFGHTHRQYYAENGGLVILNPGAADTTAALMTIENGEIDVRLL